MAIKAKSGIHHDKTRHKKEQNQDRISDKKERLGSDAALGRSSSRVNTGVCVVI